MTQYEIVERIEQMKCSLDWIKFHYKYLTEKQWDELETIQSDLIQIRGELWTSAAKDEK